ncbi:hypothetical protein [Ramlibacter algicola]|uniref:Uncharacterized protein n=1 Tax=Ramlibacter algicola TaxID=2795217 RepID=A0A934PVV0_9BURK|nr:hypothetical protein [Ramlibacter algicola]MBK0391415.1 hypothetical protein [Ramlibacter algicola]
MFTLVSLLARAFQAQPAPHGIDPLRHLMERANARSGHDADELRAAAGAWLRVIR